MSGGSILLILEVIDRLLGQAARYSALAKRAQSEGRDVSREELQTLQNEDDDQARKTQAAIDAMSGE